MLFPWSQRDSHIVSSLLTSGYIVTPAIEPQVTTARANTGVRVVTQLT